MAKLTKELLDRLILEALLGEQAKPLEAQDYLDAIDCGANMIRCGSIIFKI